MHLADRSGTLAYARAHTVILINIHKEGKMKYARARRPSRLAFKLARLLARSLAEQGDVIVRYNCNRAPRRDFARTDFKRESDAAG